MKNNAARSFIGFLMFVGGLYLMLQSIRVDIGNLFQGRYSLFHVGGFGVTSGSVMLVFMLGVGLLFFNAKNPLGWLVTTGSLTALIVGVIYNTHFSLQYMSAFDLIVILVLLCGGLGLLLSGQIGKTD